jgi:hypothetical protein
LIDGGRKKLPPPVGADVRRAGVGAGAGERNRTARSAVDERQVAGAAEHAREDRVQPIAVDVAAGAGVVALAEAARHINLQGAALEAGVVGLAGIGHMLGENPRIDAHDYRVMNARRDVPARAAIAAAAEGVVDVT